MDFIDACKVILRRWYVAVPLLLLTFAGTYYAYTSASANYTAKASLLLISPPSRTIGVGDTESAAVCPSNPWCAGGDVLNLANVVSRQMDDPGLAGELLDPHPGASYEVLLNAENRSTIMELTTTARTPEDALDTLNDLIAEVDQTLAARQDKSIVADSAARPGGSRDDRRAHEVDPGRAAVGWQVAGRGGRVRARDRDHPRRRVPRRVARGLPADEGVAPRPDRAARPGRERGQAEAAEAP